jgi:hypothetical protein
VQSGEIGEARILHGAYCQDWLFLPRRLELALAARAGRRAAGGRRYRHPLDGHGHLDQRAADHCGDGRFRHLHPRAPAPLQQVETFAGKLSEGLPARASRFIHEDYAAVLFQFDNGARGSVTLSQISAGRKNHFWWEINGSKGSLKWEQERPNEMWLGFRERENGLLLKDPSLMQPAARRYAGYPVVTPRATPIRIPSCSARCTPTSQPETWTPRASSPPSRTAGGSWLVRRRPAQRRRAPLG